MTGHWSDERLTRRGRLDPDTTIVVADMSRRSHTQDRAYRAGTWRRPWAAGDWHGSRKGAPWPGYAAQPYRWGLEAAEQADREKQADLMLAMAQAQLGHQAAVTARRRAQARRVAGGAGRVAVGVVRATGMVLWAAWVTLDPKGARKVRRHWRAMKAAW